MMHINDGPLESLNQNNRYDLNESLTLTLGNDNDSNPYTDHPLTTTYLDTNNLPLLMNGNNKIIFPTLNIRSLMSNHEQLSSLLNDLVRKNVNIAAVALQEVWAVPYPDLVNIPGFNLILNTRSCSRGGGVGFYIKDNIDYKIINNLSPFFEKEFESLTIEISTPGKKIMLSNVYRSPSPSPNQTASSQIDLFLNRFDSHLHNLFQLNQTSLVFLDSNINLLKLPNNQTALDYLETIHSNGYLQIISKATRIAGDSFSLIDHILCKNYDPTIITGTLVTDISNHFMNLVCFSANHKPKTNTNSKYMRSFSLQNITNFHNALNNIHWHSVYATDEVNLSFNNFWDTFSTLYDLHFPLTKFKLNRNIHRLNDFMTTALLISR
jgi:hypothetical protein